jgi:hypothetical protein
MSQDAPTVVVFYTTGAAFHVSRSTFHVEARKWRLAKEFGVYSLQLSAKQAKPLVCWPQTVSCKLSTFFNQSPFQIASAARL